MTEVRGRRVPRGVDGLTTIVATWHPASSLAVQLSEPPPSPSSQVTKIVVWPAR